MHQPLYPQGKNSWYPLHWRLDGYLCLHAVEKGRPASQLPYRLSYPGSSQYHSLYGANGVGKHWLNVLVITSTKEGSIKHTTPRRSLCKVWPWSDIPQTGPMWHVAIHPVFLGLSPVLTLLSQCPDRFVWDGQMSRFWELTEFFKKMPLVF
jgi:hypothetical protein